MEELTDILTPFPVESEKPRLIIVGENLGDNPETHRWRAWWERLWSGSTTGIRLSPYKVLKATSCGVWIDPFSYGKQTPNGWEWQDFGHGNRRWVSNDGGQAWAKPTQQEALHSLAIRLCRWGLRLRQDVDRMTASAHALAVIMPERKAYAETALSHFPELPRPESLK